MRRWWLPVVPATLVAILSSCYPGEISSTGETDLVVTGARPDYGFNKKTYYMSDEVICIELEEDRGDSCGDTFDADILAAVEAGLASYNYTRLPVTADPETADLLVLNAITVNVNIEIWTYWPGYYPPYWGCCYGGYPWWPVSGVTAWQSGTVLTLMQDPALESSAAEDAGDVWVGAMNGLAGTTDADARSRITRGIAQAFEQSPYLAGGSAAN
jgi:hypothetical protein